MPGGLWSADANVNVDADADADVDADADADAVVRITSTDDETAAAIRGPTLHSNNSNNKKGDDDTADNHDRGDGIILSNGTARGDLFHDTQTDTSSRNYTYPADCYSFLALHSPYSNFGFFLFGFMVWAFQIAFLILMVMRVIRYV